PTWTGHDPDRPRRRDQPRDAKDAVRTPGGDGRAPGHGRRNDLSAARAVPRDGDAEPDRIRRHLPAPRGATRPVLHAHPAWLSEGARGDRDPRRAADHPSAGDDRAGHELGGAVARAIGKSRDSYRRNGEE